jgi:hypothetical protein
VPSTWLASHLSRVANYVARQLLVDDLDIRVLARDTGTLIRKLVLDPSRDYQPTGAPKGPKRKKFRT